MSLSKIVKRLANKNGFVLFRRPSQIIPKDLPDASAYREPESVDFVRLYRPWSEPSFLGKIPREVFETTVLSPTKLYFLHELMSNCSALPGDFFEAGSGSGGSAFLMANFIRRASLKKLVWTLDTFEGYHGVNPERDSVQIQQSNRKFDQLDAVRKYLQPFEDEVRIVPGIIPASLAAVTTAAICFAHIDVNLYGPTYESTCFCLERMTNGGIILFDDYNWPATFGARKAIDDASAKFGCSVISIPESTQAFLIFRKR